MWATKGRGLRASARASLALFAVAVAHLGFREESEGLRLRIAHLVLAPTVALDRPRPGTVAELGPDVRARLAWWEAQRRGTLAHDTLVPVMEYRSDRQQVVVGCGRDQGVSIGDPVIAPTGLVGFVDRIEAHLSRVSLLSAKGTRVAVTLAESRPALPGGMSRLNAIHEGDGERTHLTQGSLLEGFAVGDAVVTFGGDGDRATPRNVSVAHVVERGPKPRTELSARPEDVGFVSLPYAKNLATENLFEGDPSVMAIDGPAEGVGAIVTGATIADVVEGSAVHAHDRYLGRVVRTAGPLALCSRLHDPGHEVSVRWIGSDDRVGRTMLRSKGIGVFEFVGGVQPPFEAMPVLLLTAGGQGLVPADLVVGVGRIASSGTGLGGALVIEGSVDVWPSAVTIPVFAFRDELLRLVSGARR